jgi:hypothetical protein
MVLGTHLFSVPNVSQTGLELAYGGAEALLFSQCNVVWRSFVQAGVQGVEVLIHLGALFLPSVALASQQDFLFIELTLSASVP